MSLKYEFLKIYRIEPICFRLLLRVNWELLLLVQTREAGTLVLDLLDLLLHDWWWVGLCVDLLPFS